MAQNPTILRIWYEKVKKVWKKHNIQPQDCYNMAETGFQIGIGQSQKVITYCGKKPAALASSIHSINYID